MLKKILIFLLLIIFLWIFILFINIYRIYNYKKPILYKTALTHEYYGTYYFFGYTIETATFTLGEYVMYSKLIFGEKVLLESPRIDYEYNPVTEEITLKQ